jgi:hypothetical protein
MEAIPRSKQVIYWPDFVTRKRRRKKERKKEREQKH